MKLPRILTQALNSILALYLLGLLLDTAEAQPTNNPRISNESSEPKKESTNSQFNQGDAKSKTKILSQFEVKVEKPNSQWRILSQTQLRSLSSIAVAGAFNPKQVLGLVLVETLRDMTLNDYATALMENSPLQELLIESVSEVNFQSQKALRLVYSGDEANGRFRYLAYVFISGQKGYQVVSGGPIALVDQVKLELFASAVKLSPIPQGQTIPLSKVGQVDEYGLTWRLSKGIFRHILSGLKLTSNQAWTSTAGSSLTHINQEAFAALINQEAQVHILFFDRPCPSSDLEKCKSWVRYELLKDLGLKAIDETYQYNYLGEAQNFQRLSHERGLYTYLHNVQVKSGRALQTLAWTLHPKPTNDPALAELAFATAWKELSSAFKQISLQSTSQRSQLLIELNKLDDPKAFMRNESSGLWGKYHHFSSGLSWSRPSGLWQLEVVSSSPHLDQEQVNINAPRYGINAQVKIINSYQLKAQEAHQYLWTELKKQLSETRGLCTQGSQGTRLIAQAKSTWSRCTFRHKNSKSPLPNQAMVDIAWTYQLDSFHGHGSVIHLLSWGPQEIYEGKAEIVRESLESAFSVSTPATITFKNSSKLIDERFRYQLKDLPVGGELKIQNKLRLGHSSSLIEYSTPKLSIQSFALSKINSQQVAKLVDQLATRVTFRAQAANQQATSKSGPTKPELSLQLQREKIRLGEYTAERLTWPSEIPEVQRSALLISVPPMIYGVVAVGDPQEVKKMLSDRHFELLRPNL